MYHQCVTFYNKIIVSPIKNKIDVDGSKIIYNLNSTEYVFDTKKGILSGYKLYPVVL